MMDITRQLPSDVSTISGESEAVATLHKTLVALRAELIKRDNKIQILESKLIEKSDNDTKGSNHHLQFDDLFELVDHDEETMEKIHHNKTGSSSSSKDPLDEIVVAISDDDEDGRSESPVVQDPPCSDLVTEFVIDENDDDDDDEKEEENESESAKRETENNRDGVTFQLIPNKDLEIHPPPRFKVSPIIKTPIRPILKVPSSESRLNSGSQTDITAVKQPLTGSGNLSSGGQRHWVSEPSLNETDNGRHIFRRPQRYNTSSSVTFLLPSPDKNDEVDSREERLKVKGVIENHSSRTIITKTTSHYSMSHQSNSTIGRYSILNRDFSPKFPKTCSPLIVDTSGHDEVDLQKSQHFGNQLLQRVDSSHSNNGTESNGSIFPIRIPFNSSYNYESGSESTDSLLEEAREYLRIAKTKLVTVKDWDRIHEGKQSRKKLKKRVKHSPNSITFLSPTGGQPFVPSSLSDIRVNYLARAISSTHGLITGAVTNVDSRENQVGIRLRHGRSDIHSECEEKYHLVDKCSIVNVPFRNVVMVWKKDLINIS